MPRSTGRESSEAEDIALFQNPSAATRGIDPNKQPLRPECSPIFNWQDGEDYERERGRFRSFLLASLKHFLANEHRSAIRQKRGGGASPLSLDGLIETGEHRYRLEPRSTLTPEKIFERQWALTVLDQVLDRLRKESEQFDHLKGFLIGDEARIPYRQLANDLATTEGALKVTVHRLRQRFREVLREEIAQTVSDPEEVRQEIRYLMAVVSAPL